MTFTDAHNAVWMLSVQIYADDCDALHIWSVETQFNGVRHRMTFSRANLLSKIFKPAIALEFGNICQKIDSREHGFLIIPELMVDGLRARLAGLSAVRTMSTSGRSQFRLRFGHFIGTLNELFAIGLPFQHPVLDHREKIAVSALSDIASPLLRIASLKRGAELSAGQFARVEAKMDEISKSSSDLQFHLSLLMSYVRDCAEKSNVTEAAKPDNVERLDARFAARQKTSRLSG